MNKLKNNFLFAAISLLISCASNTSEQKKETKNPDMTGFAREVDTDKNGQMSRAEWSAKGLPESSFNMFEKGRGFVTLEDYQKNAAPAGIDINGDGTLTVAEFLQFDKEMSKNMPPSPKSH